MPTDRALLKQQQTAALGTTLAAASFATVDLLHADPLVFDKAAADALASTTTAETGTGIYVPAAARILSVTFVPTSGGVTADNTNFATVTVSTRDSAGATLATVATLTTTITSSGNLTQYAGKALVLTAANQLVSAGSTVTFSIAKSGTGVIVPAGRVTVLLTYV
jgi:hypothetical protein